MDIIGRLGPGDIFLIGLFVNIAVVWGGLWLLKRDIERYDDPPCEPGDNESVNLDSGADPTPVVDEREYLSDYDFYGDPNRNRDD